MELKFFITVESLIAYSNERFKIRAKDSRIHRIKAQRLNSFINGNLDPNNANPDINILRNCLREREFRETIKSMKLATSTKIL